MELILLERVEGLGNVGDEVTVRSGYARNYLLPQNKAILSTVGNRKIFERQRDNLEEKQHTAVEEAKKASVEMAELKLNIERSTSDGKHLYGSVNTTDLSLLLVEAGYKVERRQIILDHAIKTVGDFDFRVRLHPDVLAQVPLSIISTNS
ncbi:MAG: 50S ribosomal protein L9 [Mariprofundaceae bacterium]|nr:50S ribosomal protein L9 [Mariprofundaceae bacterium]